MKIKYARLLGQSGLHTTRNTTICWARMQARKEPVGPQGSFEQVGPVGLLRRGARESYRTGAYKNQCGSPSTSEVGLNLHSPFSTGPWLQPVLKGGL